ncbi:hypothetical protein BS17DRAFT_780432 [Gyrodon lividus]|nr:hypothetical protein BS17DRAFT_780432 [Gyrodon lividus]
MGPNLQLEHIDLNSGSRDTVAALVKLLSPHAPYSLHILGTILNAGQRSMTIGNVDPSKVFLWSTTPLRLSNDNPPPKLFSILIFSPIGHDFRFFCSAESSPEPPTKVEETHVERIFKMVRHMAREESPKYDSVLIMKSANRGLGPTVRVDNDPPMIIIGGVHEKWKPCITKSSECQNPVIRYILPRSTSGSGATLSRSVVQSSDDLVISQIRQSDIAFVRAASSIPRSEEYIMSRAAYSVCLRTRGGDEGDEGGEPVAWALLHADGSIGALHVDPQYQRRGLGKLVLNSLAKKLDFGKVDGEPPSVYDDLGGGALGWNWTDTEWRNDVGNLFFTSWVGRENGWTCHWTYMLTHLSDGEQQ